MTKASIHVKKIGQLNGHKAAIYSLDDGLLENEFYSAGGEGWLIRWNLSDFENGELVARAPSNIFSLKFLSEKQQLLCGNMNGGIHLIDPRSPENNKNIAHHQKGIFGIEKINDSLLSVGGDGLLSRWTLANMRVKESIQLSASSLRCISINKAKTIAAIGSSDNNIYLVDIDRFVLLHTIEAAHMNSVFSVCFNKDESHLISGGRDAQLKIWDLPDLKMEKPDWTGIKELNSIPAHLFTVNDITFHPELNIFASASRDKTIKLWSGKNYQLLKVLDFEKYQGHVNSVNKLLWSTYNNYLISCSDDRRILVWDINFNENLNNK